MLAATLMLGIIAATMVFIGYRMGGGQHVTGMKNAFTMLIELIPLLVFAFIIAGMVQTIVSPQLVAKWVGEESGLRGVLIGSVAGGLCPGGPFVSLPIAGGLLRAGASMGTMVAFITGWSLWAVSRLPLEVGILGWKLTVIRFLSTLIFPPIAGLLAQVIFGTAR